MKSCVPCHILKTFLKKNFNIGFGNPRVNVCSTCDLYEGQIAATNDPILKTEYKLDQLKAKRFYSELRKSQADPKVLCIAFDM